MKVTKRERIGDKRTRKVIMGDSEVHDIGDDRYTLDYGDTVEFSEEFISADDYHSLPRISSRRQDPFDGVWIVKAIKLISPGS